MRGRVKQQNSIDKKCQEVSIWESKNETESLSLIYQKSDCNVQCVSINGSVEKKLQKKP